MSKLQSDAVREAISQIVSESKNDKGEKKRKFTETVELQIGLKNYDPQKDKRFSGSVKLPHIPRPKMKICMLGDAQHVEEAIFSDTTVESALVGRFLFRKVAFSYPIALGSRVSAVTPWDWP